MNGQYNTYDGAGGCSDTRREVFRRAGSRMNDPCSLAGGRLSLAGARLLDLTPHWHWLSPSHRSPHLTGRQRVFVSLSRTITSHVTSRTRLRNRQTPHCCPSRGPQSMLQSMLQSMPQSMPQSIIGLQMEEFPASSKYLPFGKRRAPCLAPSPWLFAHWTG